MKKILIVLAMIPLLLHCERPQSVIDPDQRISALATTETEVKIKELLSRMTLKEKLGQMLNIGIPSIMTGAYFDTRDSVVFDQEKYHRFIVEYGVGSIHNTPGLIPDKEEWFQIIKKIQDTAMTKTRLGIPILYGIDNIHGANYVNGSVMFPHQIGLAATWNVDLAEQCGAITSYESRAASLPWNYNPNVDVAVNPLWGRIAESFGEDQWLITEMGAAYQRGSLGTGLHDPHSTAVCLKHYLGYGAGTNGKDRANAIIPERNLRQYYLPPFERGIKEGAMAVMISSNAVNGIPCHSNAFLINDLLKDELNFQGVVISDFSDVEFLIDAHQVAKDKREATKLAVNAGLDMIMNPYDVDIVDILYDLVKSNEVSMERIDDAVTRILRLKFYLNLFEVPYTDPSSYPDVGGTKHMEANYDMAAESMTLLKNKNSVLPLPKGKKILVTGYAANSMNVLNGAWSRSFLGRDTSYNDPSKLTIYGAIAKVVGTEQVTYLQGTDYDEDINTAKVVEQASKADYIVVCVGEIPATEVPSNTNELELPKVQQDLIRAMAQTQKPIILVMVQGRPRIIREVEPLTDAILMAYLPGQEGGRAVADVLFGAVNPSGKLPYTYPKYSGFVLPYYHKKTDARDVNWGFDGFDPQFQFGHGLSYTAFEYADLQVSKDTLVGDPSVSLTVNVTNTGTLTGKEIVQCYIHDKVASIAPDTKRLLHFEKVSLDPGETKTITFELDANAFSFVGKENTWILEPGDFQLFVGGDPDKMLQKELHLTK
jgi:beta-glucosidase